MHFPQLKTNKVDRSTERDGRLSLRMSRKSATTSNKWRVSQFSIAAKPVPCEVAAISSILFAPRDPAFLSTGRIDSIGEVEVFFEMNNRIKNALSRCKVKDQL